MNEGSYGTISLMRRVLMLIKKEKKTLLLVDDEKDILDSLSSFLRGIAITS